MVQMVSETSTVRRRDEFCIELDSHADTCVIGHDALIIGEFNKHVSVTQYNHRECSKMYKIISAMVAYDDHDAGQAIVVVMHQAIHVPNLDHHLLCPMQARLNDIVVNDAPKCVHPNPTERTHVIVARIERTADDAKDEFIIPLSLNGVASYFPVRKPTMEEYEAADARVTLTVDLPTWNPH